MRIALIDLLFHYPPQGGACVDLVETFSRLASHFDIKVFHPSWDTPFPRGSLASPPPLPFEPIRLSSPNKQEIIDRIYSAVTEWGPDAILIGDGWTLKPYLINALKGIAPIINRFYAYEGICPRNNERWLFDRPCDNDALTDCGKCLACAKDYARIVREKKQGQINPLIHEAEIAGIHSGDYREALKASIDVAAIIVYNKLQKKLLAPHTRAPIHIVPGGVDLDFFQPSTSHAPPRLGGDSPGFSILVFGRMDDPAKGADIAVQAGKLLARQGFSLEMAITRRRQESLPWLKEIGWTSRDDIKGLLAKADCVIVPSRWEEAFGMTWLEAMAMRVPVIASDTAGPREHIIHGVNGLLFPNGDATALAERMMNLHHDKSLAEKLSENGYLTAQSLTWDHASAIVMDIIKAAL